MNKFIKIILCAIFALFVATDKTILYQNISNNTFRIDIFGQDDTNDVQILQDGTNLFSSTPTWCKNCIILTGDFNKHKNTKIKLKANKNETINIKLRGKDLKQNGRRIPLFVNYSGFIVNQTPIEIKKQNIWHDNPYTYKIDAKRNDTIEISVLPKKPSIFNTLLNCHIIIYLFIIAFLFIYFVPQIIEKHIKKTETTFPDFIFIVIFLLLLIIPMSDISRSEKSEQENRILATKPQLIIDNKINEKYGTQFDAWFNDRFNGRDILIKNFTKMKYAISNIYQNDKALVIKNNNWMFQQNTVNFLSENLQTITKSLQEFDNFCEQHNIKLYVLLTPNKEMIYSDILSKNYGFNHRNAELFNTYISKIQHVIPKNRILYPYTELLTAKQNDYVFFKQAHHWTDYGAYIGYQKLAQRIKQDFKDFNIVSLYDYNKSYFNMIRDDWNRKYNKGHTINLLNLRFLADTLLDTSYTYYDNKNSDKLTETRLKYTKLFDNKTPNVHHKIFLTGNSQNENLLQFLPYSVKSLKYLRLNLGTQPADEQWKFMKHYKQELLEYNPDIVVICISVNVFPTLMIDFYKD